MSTTVRVLEHPAKRGDGVALVQTSRISAVNGLGYDYVTVRVAKVTSVHRDGSIAAVSEVGSLRPTPVKRMYRTELLVIEQDRYDIDRLLAQLGERTFRSTDELRTAIREANPPIIRKDTPCPASSERTTAR